MAEKVDFVFDSASITGVRTYQLASGYISQTTILFEKENVAAVIQAKGSVEFFDRNDVLIASGSVPVVTNGRGVYEDIGCRAKNGRIQLRFPIYEWIDNYPYCDGEYDRWDTKIVGYHALTLDLSNGSIESCDVRGGIWQS